MGTDLLSAIQQLAAALHGGPVVYITISTGLHHGADVGVQVSTTRDADIDLLALALMASPAAADGAELLSPGAPVRTDTCEWREAKLRIGRLHVQVYGNHRMREPEPEPAGAVAP